MKPIEYNPEEKMEVFRSRIPMIKEKIWKNFL